MDDGVAGHREQVGGRMVGRPFAQPPHGHGSSGQPARRDGLGGAMWSFGGDRPPRQGLGLHQPRAWLERLLVEERARLSYAQRGAKDNPWIESFWGRFETENGELILEAQTMEEVRTVVGEQLDYYNRRRRHWALDYRVPYEIVSETIAREDGHR